MPESTIRINKVEVPAEFICAITMEIMEHPLATRHGQNFERTAIVTWLQQGVGECPLTRRPLKMSDLIHNNKLAAKIQAWRVANKVPSDCTDGSDESETEEEELVRVLGMASIAYNAIPESLPSSTPSDESVSRSLPPTSRRRANATPRRSPSRRLARNIFRTTMQSWATTAPIHV